jgi:hypothetical protein
MERREGGEGDSKIVLRRRRRLRVTRGEGVGERREERRVKKGGWRDMRDAMEGEVRRIWGGTEVRDEGEEEGGDVLW